jgi:hypothetical protein
VPIDHAAVAFAGLRARFPDEDPTWLHLLLRATEKRMRGDWYRAAGVVGLAVTVIAEPFRFPAWADPGDLWA